MKLNVEKILNDLRNNKEVGLTRYQANRIKDKLFKKMNSIKKVDGYKHASLESYRNELIASIDYNFFVYVTDYKKSDRKIAYIKFLAFTENLKELDSGNIKDIKEINERFRKLIVGIYKSVKV